MSSDERFEFIIENICTICRISKGDRRQIETSISKTDEILVFLDDTGAPALKIVVLNDFTVNITTKLNASKSISDDKILNELVFIRRSFDPITSKNIEKCLDVHTIQGSALESLGSVLKGIWCPTLLQNSQWNEKLPPKVQQLLSDLESALNANALRDIRSTDTRSKASNKEDSLENVADIYEPMDEFSFWRKIKDDRKSPYCHLGRVIDNEFSKLSSPGFDDLLMIELSSINDFIAKTFDCLNAAWMNAAKETEFAYPQKRMEHLFTCIGSAFCRYFQKKLSVLNIWSLSSTNAANGSGTGNSDTNFSAGESKTGGNRGGNDDEVNTVVNKDSSRGEVRLQLTNAVTAIVQWCEVPRSLTRSYWAGGATSRSAWKGEVYNDTYACAFQQRLEQVISILSTSQELSQLLTPEERRAFHTEKLYRPLESTHPLLYNPYTQPQWLKAVKEFDKALAPVETAVISRFKNNLNTIMNQPQLVVIEFQKYRSLINRPTIRVALVSERETLLTMLRDLVKRIEQMIDKIEYEAESGQKDDSDIKVYGVLSPRINHIVQLRQLHAKLTTIRSTAVNLLTDLDGFERFKAQCDTLLTRIKSEENTRYTSWLSDIQQRIEDDDPALTLSGSLMSWKDGILTVNFSSDLVAFAREVHQIQELGFEIPKTKSKGGSKDKGKAQGILEKAMEAEKYYRYGILLMKTANFYNSISEQMIDVQEQLLLDSLTAFANIVSKQGGDEISWGNTVECENYIFLIQKAAEKLSSENRNLRKIHESLCELTIGLMQIDFLKQTEMWKLKWRTIKDKMNLVKNKYPSKDCKLWILHWDSQIYKALEVSYQMGLESLNENLTEIKIDLVFTNKQLDFKPPLEQIRQSYYTEIRKFVGMPNTFEGFGNTAVFKKMGPKNANRFYQVYRKAENLFQKLSVILKRYEPWVSLGMITDLDAFIEANVTQPDEYITNFKTLRLKRKSVDKIPDIEKINCCTISLMPFKNYLEDLYQRINDALLISLRRSLLIEFKEVDLFLEQSNDRLNSRPHSVEEIGTAKKEWKDIDTKKDLMKSLSKACVEKKKLLMQYAPGTVVDISEVSNRMANLEGEGGRWDEFDIALEAFNDLVEEQKEALKVTLDDEVMTLNVNIDKFSNRWKQLKPELKSWDMAEILRVFDSLDDWKRQFEELTTKSNTLTENCQLFAMSKPRFDGLENLNQDLTSTMASWDLLKAYYDELKLISDQDWLTFSVNVYVLQDFAMKWSEKLKQMFGKSTYSAIADHISDDIDKFKKAIPTLKYCQGEPFKEDHWIELLQGKLKLPREVTKENVKVEHFLSKIDILIEPSTLPFVKNLQSRALGEVQIREALQELKTWERSAELKLLTTEESGRKIPLIKEWKDLILEMGDKQSLLSSLKENEFFKAFQDQGLALEAKMTVLDGAIHTLNSIQRKWVYLEPIFGRGALPTEEMRFRRIDEEFSDIMNTLSKEPKLFYLADEQIFPHLVQRLKDMLDQLERCQKALTDFLEAKRSAMPRFYFIGDDDLLEILGQAKNPSVIQSHLKKLFQGINKVKFNENSTKIVAMVSSANEVVTLETPVTVNEKVEDWLELLANEMRATLTSLLNKCLKMGKFDWNYPSQILCLMHMIKFTQDAELAIKEGVSAMKSLSKSLNGTLRELTSQDLSAEPLLQLKIKALVFDIVHNIDVVSQLISRDVRGLNDWTWKKQLRYYSENGSVIVRMYDAKFQYTYEYQGNIPKLVHTPLTDKCYLTLTQGMNMGFGGNPYGPAGTGKTESVKALASCLGRQVLVFNCDEALESTSMIRIFMGIVKCGAWGCFDEFNRLKEDQLSAISQQIQTIQDAIKMKVSPISLLGRNVDVDFNSGIFVTLNPAGKGYGGRSRLPDNLKALFRPVAMGAPDNELIAEVSLVTEGFTQAKELASKIVSLFKLSKQLLSAQQHYDWGLRGLKAVLNSGGRLIQSYQQAGTPIKPETEYEILIKALRVNTLSKLTFSDTQKFLPLIGDVFPGVQSSDISGGDLEAAIKEVMKEKPFYLVEDAAQIKKMIQLKESLDQRIGCVIVGPSGCGKSSLWRVLKAAMVKCGQPVVTYVMNPKSMHRERLLGHMDIDTREWSDGVLTDAARKVVKESPEVKCWIVCDGDVDPEWIESLNSVLDDNHLLTLPNGERIAFGPNVNFLFETHDLKYASPATVSRMGMIFLSDEELDVSRLIQRWLSTFPQERKLSMSTWIDELFYKALNYVSTCEYIVDTTLVGAVMNGLCQVKSAKSKPEFICGLIRGLGGNLSIAARAGFAKELFQWASERPPDFNNPLDCYADGNSYVQFTNSVSPKEADAYTIQDLGEGYVVPTISVQRTLLALEPLITNMEPFIVVGPEGCGKNMLIKYAFRQKRGMSIAVLNCNAQTTANDVINKIAQTCSLFSSPEGRVYRPRDAERLVLYLKDINLPRPDMYETCQLIAFLQQLITFEGFYDNDLEFLKLERIQIVASMNAATTVGRHQLSTRFTAIVRILNVDYPEPQELSLIYECFLGVVLNNTAVSDRKWMQSTEKERLANTIVEIYQKTREKFTVDDRRHYLFTLRDITDIVRNLSRYDLGVENLLDALANEASRIFRDRLVGSDASNKFDQILVGILRSNFRHSITSSPVTYFTSLTSARSQPSSEAKEADGLRKDYIGGELHRMTDDDFKKLVTQGLMYYEREERDLNMLLFPEILEHIAYIDRVLSGYGGHCLLVGRSGCGRRDAVTVTAYMLGYEYRSPAVSRNYSQKQFIADIKTVLQIAGVKGDHILFYIEDYQITNEAILETVNSLLSAGEVPGMYTHEELEPMLSPLREKMREAGNFRTPYEFFVSRIRKYLHIVVSMDPLHPKFLYRCESNPALYSHCTVLWMGEWRTNTLQVVPKMMEGVRDLIPNEGGGENGEGKDDDDDGYNRNGDSKRNDNTPNKSRSSESKVNSSFEKEKSPIKIKAPKGNAIPGVNADQLIEMLIQIHSSCVDSQGAVPRDYMAFLKMWHTLCVSKKSELLNEVGHLEAGLDKLESAATIVNDLRTNAKQQQRDLNVAQAAADKAMEDISKALSGASDRRNEVAEVKKTVAQNEKTTQARKAEIEEELSEIQPVLDEAKRAVGGIRSDQLAEIRSLAAPPEAVADVIGAVLMLLGVEDLSWLSMKKFLGGRGVKEEILNFDTNRITDDIRRNVAKLMKKKAASFEEAVITRASVAAAPMAAWVKANIKYSLVAEKVMPLQRELDEEVIKLKESTNRLQQCEQELSYIDVKVAELKTEFANRTAEAERLKRNLALAGTTLDKAEKLIGQLGGEQKRWRIQANALNDDLGKLPVKMLLAAGFITYLAQSPEDTRTSMVSKWQNITGLSSNFEFKRVMSTESELLKWKAMGLPSDDLSQENGLAIVTLSDRFPFVIDPASAATDWLRSILSQDKSRPLEVVSSHDVRFINQVELAVRFGKTLLILEVDGIEPMLYPLCRKDLIHQGARFVVSVGDKIIDYNENFRLVLATRNPTPELPPDAASLVMQVNFTVTRSGLEGQLLGIAIQHEQPELEKAKGEMLKKEEDFKVQLAALEKDLLQSLATAEGNLLENTTLIESLTRTKEKSAEIESALVQSAEASVKLDQQREVYRPFASAGSKLFFIVKSLKTINNMYQFSLASFLVIFKKTMNTEMTVKDMEEKLSVLRSTLEIKVLDYVGQALFKADRLMFALNLIKRMHHDQFQPKEWEIFTGVLVSSVSEGAPKGFPSWASTERQAAFRLLQENLPHLMSSLETDNTSKWQKFATSLEAERDLPSLRGLTPFQKVLLIQAFRPDRLQSAMIMFCTDLLRVDSISPPSLSLANMYSESEPLNPILLISSPGSDASKELQEFAEKTIGSGNYDALAMGGGQQDIAINMLRTAAANGGWLCLKNLHLVVAWLPTLEKELSSLKPHPNFRLWLTSEGHQSFPSILLQESLKATYEAPPGLKMNLERTFESWDKDMFTKGEVLKNRLFFLLACFHAVIQERRTYIPQGWSKFYEFSYGDIKAGTFVMEAAAVMASKGGQIDWEAIYGLMQDAIYGGRVDNAQDQRVLRSYLQMFFNDALVVDKAAGVEVLKGTPLRIPQHSEYDSFVKIITQMPDTDSPFIFGLPDNIERSLQRTLSTAVISQLRTLSAADVQAKKFDRERWRVQLGPVIEMWASLTSSAPGILTKPARNNKEMHSPRGGPGEKSSGGGGGNKQNPVDDFVNMENELAAELCVSVDNALAALKKVLFGSGLLTPFIQNIASSLLSRVVPAEWTKQWETGPEKPQSWLRELVRKRITLTKWRSAVQKGSLLSEPLCLGDVFNPATFINALRQLTARTAGTAIDRMKLVSSWETGNSNTSALKAQCPHPCTLSGLLLQGCSLHPNGGYLQESSPDATELSAAPLVTIGFIKADDDTNGKEESKSESKSNNKSGGSSSIGSNSRTTNVPLFVSTSREEYLLDLEMAVMDKGADASIHKWVLAGAALFLREDD